MDLPLVPILAGLLVAAVVLLVLVWRRYEALLREHEQQVKEASRRSLDQSRSTLKGQIAEEMAPLLPGFPYSPADAKFIGDPIDYLVFPGRAEFGSGGDREEDCLEVVLLEIKRGQSKLSSVQKAIAAAVEEGRVRFEVAQVGEDGRVNTSAWRHPRGDRGRD